MLVHVISRFLCKNFPSLAFAALLLFLGTGAAWAGGSAYFNYQINWKLTPDLYFSVAGGPPSTCGDLVTTRNGSLHIAQDYVCTDASGNATMGPWSWAGIPSDQTDQNLHVLWPDGTTTNKIWHIFDKLAPTTTISSSGAPPNSFSGTATDPQWGAGFKADYPSHVQALFRNVTTGYYWTPTLGSYSGVPRCRPSYPGGCIYPWVDGTLSGMPSYSVSWSTPFPPASAHVPGNTYEWKVCVYDNYNEGQGGCATITFTP